MIIFYYGQDGYRICSARDEAIHQFQKKHPDGISITRCDCTLESDIESFSGACKTIPFFGGMQLIVLDQPFAAQDISGRIAQILIASNAQYAQDLAILAIARGSEQELMKKHPELFKIFSSGKPVKCFNTPRGRELQKWIREECENLGGRISITAVISLAQTIELDTWLLAQEIRKLCAYASGEEISVSDVELLVQPAIKQNVFALTDAIASKASSRAIMLLDRQLFHGADPIQLLGILAWQFRVLLTVGDLHDRGLQAKDIAKRSKLNPFVVQSALRYIGMIPAETLCQHLNTLHSLDVAAKQGKCELASDLFSFVLAQGQA